MIRLMIVLLLIAILPGCGTKEPGVDRAMDLRQRMTAGSFSFQCEVTADYGDRIYVFSMDCVADATGNIQFKLLQPDTVSGISGSISQHGGKLTFDDQVLLFEPLTQGELTPSIAPWIMVKAIQGGYVRSVENQNSHFEIVIDDYHSGESFKALLTVDQTLYPEMCEIIWNNRRVLSIRINGFQYL